MAETAANGKPRVQIDISDYAEINVEDAWGKSQNPVWFTDLETLGVDLSEVEFQPVPPSQSAGSIAEDRAAAIRQFREQISDLYQVPVRQVEITINL
ncbi:MAG: hypothetical protein V7703_01270 [Hyphomicrobiales bacterium]